MIETATRPSGLPEIGASEALAVCPRPTLSPGRCSSSVWEVAELYGSEKPFVVEVQRALSGLHSTALIALERRRLEPTQATPDQPVDDEAVYFNAAGECPKGRVYGLKSLGRKRRRYADLGASTSQMPEMVARS
ncbi:hypothetical protein Syun_016973 [Stephania yunnanensis]|uniref:Uncharacterized protein n=1 Tax=Stephania yunnanensis TaxID=152371 RepID=A0AAP0J8C7_9MAGN